MSKTRRPRLAVWKFTSCDGCQHSLLQGDGLLELSESVEIASFPEASRAVLRGPYDLSLVEGSVTTAREIDRLQEVRKSSSKLVTLGACATSGGLQALRNLVDVQTFAAVVYAQPAHVKTLERSYPISAYVKVDFELRGCPVSKAQVLEVVSAILNRRRPITPARPVCVECKLRANACVMVTRAVPCMGPVTHGGCDALCPSFERGCYGCYGPADGPNTDALVRRWRTLGANDGDIERIFHAYHVGSEPFLDAGMSVRNGAVRT